MAAEASSEVAITESTPTGTIKPENDSTAGSLGRRGGLKGGKARAASLTPESNHADVPIYPDDQRILKEACKLSKQPSPCISSNTTLYESIKLFIGHPR